MLKTIPLIGLIGLVLAVPTAGNSHPAGKKGPQHGGQIHQRIQKLRAEILRYDVGLDKAKAAKVKKILEGFDPVRKQLHQRKRMAKRALRRLLRVDSNDQAAFKRVLDDFMKVRDDLVIMRRKQMIALRKELTPKQQAKLLVALKRLQRRVRRARQQLRGGHGRRGRKHFRGQGPGRHRGPGMRQRGPRGGQGPGHHMPPHQRDDDGDDPGLL